jgi:endonuclease/exonuclease/phosphatase family metal-dependent hydrolase
MTSAAFTLSTFNVKDLIEPLFVGEAGEAARRAKLATIGAEIARANPDVLGLQEIGSELLVRQIAAEVTARTGSVYTVVMGTVDARGIGCALLSRLPVLRGHVHETDELPFPTFDPSDPPSFRGRLPLRRGIVHALVESPFGAVDVLVAHFKSRRGVPGRAEDGSTVFPSTGVEHGEGLIRGLVWRSSEALFVRRIVDGLFTGPEAQIAVLGDLNDDVRSVPLMILRGRREAPLLGVESLVPPERRFTILHGGDREPATGEQIDHILLSPELRRRAIGAEMQNEALRRHPFPVEGEPPSADSDHALYTVRLA